MGRKQLDIFGTTEPQFPDGFRYRPELISAPQEIELVEQMHDLPFKEFEFQGFVGKRRTVSFGWKYDFNKHLLHETDDIPGFLLALRETAATFAEVAPSSLQQVMIIEYIDGAGIGWHRDRPVFGDVIGFSLLSSCNFRLRRKQGASWERVSLIAQPRSAYLLRGPSRWEWEHSIPGVDALRYSITFRNFRQDFRPQ
ncbi:MAG: alpha-ketoglutarate-dependent dioxygenase AlkB [Phycisphaerae bacterium]|nr:alpha-ketoglutarate-dependent dioxygenase AlkB [Gemmatimonadaceae bacterium]